MGTSKDILIDRIDELEADRNNLASFIESLGYNDSQISVIVNDGKLDEPVALSNQKTIIDIVGFNNADLGYKKYGGAEYIKTKASVELLDKKYLNWKIERYVPSGYGDGNHPTIRGDLVLTDTQLQIISKIGFRKSVKQILELPDYLECKFDSALLFMKESC
ncbi:MAG: hypothetical protein U9R37_02370 [Campylobacterota bacterium]|nr:hypothetical protein [Campylobacterota bacterium]